MKQKAHILRFVFRLQFFLLPAFASQLLCAQEDNKGISPDSIHISHRGDRLILSLPDLSPAQPPAYPVYSSEQTPAMPRFTLKGAMHLPYTVNPSPLFRGDYSTSGILKQFPHGSVFGSGSQTSLPGIGHLNEASLGYAHALNDKLSLQFTVNALKMNMAHFAGQSFSTAGALTYRPSERVAFKLFGSYDIGNSYGMSTHRYGATMSFDMSERFGMEIGVQRYYDAMRGRWETVPIVIPYYHFEKFTLGLDVGGILYDILRNTVFDDSGGGGGATIGPPRFQMPPLK